jgi:hypothetical protein
MLAGGLMIACASLDNEEAMRFGDLFAGFRQAPGPLAMIGVINLLIVVAAFAVLFAVGGAALFGVISGGKSSAALGSGLLSILFIVLGMITVGMVSSMLVWFAPALTALNGVSAWQGMRASFFICLRNWLPMLVFSLALLAVLVVVAILIGFVGGAISPLLGVLLALPVGAAALPVLVGATYRAYRDMFYAAD